MPKGGIVGEYIDWYVHYESICLVDKLIILYELFWFEYFSVVYVCKSHNQSHMISHVTCNCCVDKVTIFC